jgi:hypothetical protein
MEGKPGRMAQEIDSNQWLQFTAATTAAALSTSRKLIRNFSYYRNQSGRQEVVCQNDLSRLCRQIRLDGFGMLNFLEDESKQNSPFLVSLAVQINDSLEELHRKLLFFDAARVEKAILVVDRLRRYWRQSDEIRFYNDSLSHHLEYDLPKDILELEETIQELPRLATL